MRSTNRIAAASLAALAAAAAGCGDYSGPLSRDEVISMADDICAEEQQQFIEIQSKPPSTAAEGVEQTDELIATAEDALGQLQDLTPPSDLERGYERYLDAKQRALDYLEQGREAAERQDRTAYRKAVKRSVAEAKARQRLARAVGLEVCGTAPKT